MDFDELTVAEKIALCTRIIDMATGALQALFAVRGVKYDIEDLEVLRRFVQSYPDVNVLQEAITMHDALGHEAGHGEKDEVLDAYREASRRLLLGEEREEEE